MKGQGSRTKYTGDERVHSDGGAWFKKIFESSKKPSLVNKEVIQKANQAVVNEAKTEFNVAISQIFGVELKAGHAVSLSKKAEEYSEKHTAKVEKPSVTAEHAQYFAEFKKNSENRKEKEEASGIRQQLDAILAELRKLKDSSDELENVFKDVVIDTPPEKPGVYHLTFYEGFLKLVMKMRDKVEDGVIFAKLFRSRKAEKSYTSMAKKRGTSFTMHQDRAVATQTG